MLTKESKQDLRWAMKAYLLEQASVLKEGRDFVQKFVMEEATYEQLLNLCFNPKRDEVYLEAEELEKVAFKMFGKSKKVVKESTTDSVEMLEEGIKDTAKEAGKKVIAGVWKGAAAAGKKAGKASETVGKHIQRKGAEALVKAKKLGAAEKLAGMSKKKLGAAALGTTGLAGTGVVGALAYKKMRNKGKTKKESAELAAKIVNDPNQKKIWLERAEKYGKEGK